MDSSFSLRTGSVKFSIFWANRFLIVFFLIFGRPFLKWFALCYRTDTLSVLSVTLVYCGQTVGWIKMPLGTEV